MTWHHLPKNRWVNVAIKLISINSPTTASNAAIITKGLCIVCGRALEGRYLSIVLVTHLCFSPPLEASIGRGHFRVVVITMERVQVCLVMACSGVIVRPSAHALAKISLPTCVRALATARS